MNELSTMMDEVAALPTAVLVAIALLWVIEVALAVFALVRLWRTPVEQVVTGKKWVWVLVILLVNLVGPIIFLAAGRKPAAVVDPVRQNGEAGVGGAARADRATAAADLLYGSKEDQE